MMKNKILLMGLVGLMASSAALADGAYVGAGIGASALFAKNTNTGTVTTSDGDSLSVAGNSEDDNGNIGFNGTVLGGYQWDLPNRFVLGLEVFDNASSAKANAETNSITAVTDEANDIASNTTTSVKIDNVYGIRFLPGYQVTPEFQAHAIVGYARAHASVDTTNSFSSSDLGDISGSGDTNNSTNFNGYQLGVGSVAQLTKNLSLRSDIIYTGYRSQTVNDSWSNSAGTGTGSVEVTMSTLEGNVDLVYSFS